MLRTRIRLANRHALAAGMLIMVISAVALLPGCSEPLTLYHVPGAESLLAQGGKVLVLPFMDTRTDAGKEDRGDTGNQTRAIFVEALREFHADRVVDIMTPKMPKRTRSLTNAQVAELGRQYGADIVIAGQVFSFAGTRAASIPPRAGLFVRIINAHDGALLFVGDHYQAASFPGADGGRDMQALYVSARLIEGFITKLQPAFLAVGEIAPLGALAMLSPQPEKKGLLARMFKPKQEAAPARRKLFSWKTSPEPRVTLGSLLDRDIQVESDAKKRRDKGGKDERKKREPGNVVETERYLGMTASFLFSPDQWDEQFVPEVPPLIDFDENFYQLPAPPVTSDPEPLPVPLLFPDGAKTASSSDATAADDAEAGDSTESKTGLEPAVASHQTSDKGEAATETSIGKDTVISHRDSEGQSLSNAPLREHAAGGESQESPAPEQAEKPRVYRDVIVDASSAQVIDELPEIDMTKVYPNIMPADAPYPVPAPSAKLSGDELASDLLDAGGEPWQQQTFPGFPSPVMGQSGVMMNHPADGKIYSEPITMSTFAPYPQFGMQQDSGGNTLPSDSLTIPHTLTMADIGQAGHGAIGMGAFQLDPDTLEIVAITLPPASGAMPSLQAPVARPMAPVMSYYEPGMPYTVAQEVVSPLSYTPYSEQVVPAMPTAPGISGMQYDRYNTDPALSGFGYVAPTVPNQTRVSENYEGRSRHVSETATVAVTPQRKSRSASTSSKKQSEVEPFIADNSGSASAARAKPMAKRPPNRRRSRSQSVKGEMVESRASVLARAETDAYVEGPLLGGRIVSEQPRTFKTVENELSADPTAVMQEPMALVAMPRYNAGGIRVLMLPYHERDNPNNLIYNHGGGEVVTTLFGIQLASDAALNLMWDASGKANHNRLVSKDEAIEMGRQAGADYVVRGQVVEFRRAQSVPSFYSAIISTAVLAAQLFFAEMSGVDIATEMYRVSDGICVMSRRDRSQQKYVVQAEKTVRRMAQNMASDIYSVLGNPHQEAMDPLIDVLAPVSVKSDPDR